MHTFCHRCVENLLKGLGLATVIYLSFEMIMKFVLTQFSFLYIEEFNHHKTRWKIKLPPFQ